MIGSLHVLIMDDDLTIRLALAHALKTRGVQVHTCSSLEAALEAVQHHPFDVILADLRMRGQESLDGLELLKVARSVHPETRVIVMTAYGTDELEAEVRDHGGTYWAKSRDLDQLLVSVMSVPPKAPPISSGCPSSDSP
ncbi:MAG: response regulator [Candidatus Methylomirabilales bacterium]